MGPTSDKGSVEFASGEVSSGPLIIQQTIGAIKTGDVGTYITQLAEAPAGDIQKIAASQISLLTSYYNAVLAQASMSFRWALIAAGTGLVFFLGAVTFLLIQQTQTTASLISAIGGALIEVIAGINFMLYGKTTNQLAYFHNRLDQTQRFLLANSICKALTDEAKQTARSELVKVIATGGIEVSEHAGKK